jgi:hypothetical protein
MKRTACLLLVLLTAGCSTAPAPDLRTSAQETEKILTEARKTPAPSAASADAEPRDSTTKR